jgi:hypothetical protein
LVTENFGVLQDQVNMLIFTILIDVNVEFVFSKILNLEVMSLIITLNQMEISSCSVVYSEVVKVKPWINRGLSSESVLFILKPNIN